MVSVMKSLRRKLVEFASFAGISKHAAIVFPNFGTEKLKRFRHMLLTALMSVSNEYGATWIFLLSVIFLDGP